MGEPSQQCAIRYETPFNCPFRGQGRSDLRAPWRRRVRAGTPATLLLRHQSHVVELQALAGQVLQADRVLTLAQVQENLMAVHCGFEVFPVLRDATESAGSG